MSEGLAYIGIKGYNPETQLFDGEKQKEQREFCYSDMPKVQIKKSQGLAYKALGIIA